MTFLTTILIAAAIPAVFLFSVWLWCKVFNVRGMPPFTSG